MNKHIEADPSKQSLVLTILFTILSLLFWGFLLVLIIKSPIFSRLEQDGQAIQVQQDPTATEFNDIRVDGEPTSIYPTPIENETIAPSSTSSSMVTDDFQTIVSHTIKQYDYPLFFYPVSQDIRLPEEFPRGGAQLPLVSIDEVTVSALIVEPLKSLIMAAKTAGISPYLRSGFRSIDDQYTAYSRYVTEATAAGMDLAEAREYARRFSAEPGYSEHHLGLAVDLMDYFYPDWIIARKNYDKGMYLWLQLHAHEYGFVISYPAGDDPAYAKPGSGYELTEPWHLRYVGKELAAWMHQSGYLDPKVDMTVNQVMRDAYLLAGNTLLVQ
jgi:LAS superfamily LD-carboxypeptidase LdcB